MVSVNVPERTSLLVPMLDFAREWEDETNLWFDSDHVPERLSCDGIEYCERFQLTDVEPIGWNPGQKWMKYLNFYTLESLDVLDSAAYALQRDMNGGNGTAWRQIREARYERAVRPSPTRSLRTSWSRRNSTWRAPAATQAGARTILVLLRNHDDADDDDANTFIDTVLFPELTAIPGVLAIERFEARGPLVSSGARVGRGSQPQYMDVVDISAPEVATSGVFRRWVASLDVPADLRASLIPVGYGVYQQRPSPWLLTPL
jgi:hypothetical protein